MFQEIKDKRYAAYVLPVRIQNGQKQVAIIEYEPGEYGLVGGRFEDGESDAREVLRRELAEELNVGADKIADMAIEISEPYCFDIAPERWKIRCARSEIHHIFVAKIPTDMETSFCQDCFGNVRIVWMDVESLLDEKVIVWADEREYFKKHVMCIIRDMAY